MEQKGFTLFEVVIVIFILAALALVSIPAYDIFLKTTDVDSGMQEFYAALRLAQSKTLSSENDAQYGVYMDAGVSPNKYVLFKGSSYAARDSAFDRLTWLPKTVEFSGISLGGANEVVFEKLTGYAQQSGSLAVRSKADTSKLKTLYISSAGIFSFTAPVAVADTRVKDSRHVHFDYSRAINTASESLTLLFNGNVSQVIPLASNMSNGQIYWTGTIAAGGGNQTVLVHTHRLNATDTQFSVHRDRRLNDKSLKITISGDSTGSLIEYTADGAVTTSTSAYVSNSNWQ